MSHSIHHASTPILIALGLVMKDLRAELGNAIHLEENDRTIAKPVSKSLHRKVHHRSIVVSETQHSWDSVLWIVSFSLQKVLWGKNTNSSHDLYYIIRGSRSYGQSKIENTKETGLCIKADSVTKNCAQLQFWKFHELFRNGIISSVRWGAELKRTQGNTE